MKDSVVKLLIGMMLSFVFLHSCAESDFLAGDTGNIHTSGEETSSLPRDSVFTETTETSGITPDGILEYEVVNGEVRIIHVAYDCENVIIPETIDGYPVVSIGQMAFYQNCDCTSVELPATLKVIECAAFYRCYSLESVVIPPGVELIEEDAFFRASRLKSITVLDGSSYYCDIDGVLYSADKTTLVIYPEGRQDEIYAIPSHVTTISSGAFGYCPLVRKIIIPQSVIYFPEKTLAAISDKITIVAEIGSAAEAYALTYGIKFE